MKKLLFISLLLVSSIGMLADTDNNNGVTRIREGRYTKVVYPDNFKPKKSKYGKVINQADIYLDYYVLDGKEQYAIAMKYTGVLLDFPGILPSGSSMKITTANGHDMSLNSILVQNETNKHLGEEGVVVCGYFLLSKQQLDEICLGVSSVSFDIVISDKITTFNDKATIKGNKFSKEINSFYKAIQKEKSKLNISENKSETENSNIVLSYHGFEYNPFLYGEFLKWSDLQHDEITWEAFLGNQDAINSQYNSMLLDVVMKNARPSEFARSLAGAFNGVLDGVNMYAQMQQQERAQKAAEEKARQEQANAELMAAMEETSRRNQQEREAAEQRSRERIYSQSESLVDQMNREKARTQNRQAETSDGAQYMAQRMSDATYGTATTNRALAQQRQYNAQQNQQVQAQQRQVNQQQRQQLQSQQSYPGNPINAITSTGAHVQIKVNGNQVTAYSSGNNLMGPEWSGIVPAATVQDTSNPISQASRDIASRFAYQASVRGLGMVYWGTPTQRVINDAPQGTPVKAVTQNGNTLTIMIKEKKVVAYGSGQNQASDIQWKSIVPSANIAETNSSFDGEFATRFKYKATISGIGIVYF